MAVSAGPQATQHGLCLGSSFESWQAGAGWVQGWAVGQGEA